MVAAQVGTARSAQGCSGALSTDSVAFRCALEYLFARNPRWAQPGRMLSFIREVASHIPEDVRGVAFLRVNRHAVSLNIGNYWLAEVRPGRVCLLATGAHPAVSGWRRCYTATTIDAVLLCAERPEVVTSELWADHEIACRIASEGPQGRLNSHPRKTRFSTKVLEAIDAQS